MPDLDKWNERRTYTPQQERFINAMDRNRREIMQRHKVKTGARKTFTVGFGPQIINGKRVD